MFPIIPNKIYSIDFEVKPLKQYENVKYVPLETEDEDRLETDKPNFYPWTSEIYGLGIAWGLDFDTESIYFTGEEIQKALKLLELYQIPLGAHNVLFDWLNAYYHYEVTLNFVTDSGVFSQCINNSDSINSFGLKQTTARLFNVVTQDVELKEYLKHIYKIAAGNYGAYIHLCPTEMIEKYCRLDALYCWRIIEEGPKYLVSDISIYMKLYITEVKSTIKQFINGIKINEVGFKIEREKLQTEILSIDTKFRNHEQLEPFIETIEYNKFMKVRDSYKKKIITFEEWKQNPLNKFNINSTAQLKSLFDAQKLHWSEDTHSFNYPYVNTFTHSKIKNKDSPKLGTKFLYAYGVGGEILGDLGERRTLLNHINKALEEGFMTGRIHPHINLLGTASGRISASGVNILATPFSEPAYGKNIIADDGWVILAKDFRSLEPTILACLSGDPVMQYITYFGEGKEPFIKDDILWIDDTYVSAAYSAPFMRKQLMENLVLSNWTKDPDGEKKKFKLLRAASKTMVLSSNYGAGPDKVKDKLREDLKINESLKNVKEFQRAYWSTFAVAAQYIRNLELEAKERGYLVNSGGFPLIFYDRPGGIISGTHKAPNRVIQSTAAFIMKLLIYFSYKRLHARTDIIPMISNFHDAAFYYVRKEVVEEANSLLEDALNEVNLTLQWPLKLRLDKHIGDSAYACK